MKYFLLLPLALACLGHAKVIRRQRHPYVLEGNGAAEVQGSLNESHVEEANDYIDLVLQQKVPRLFNLSSQLYPSAPIPPFTFTVHKTSFTNRDLKVNVTRGAFKNFDWAIRRVGDCKPVLVGHNTSISCTLAYDGIEANLVALTEGDTIFGSAKTVNIKALVYNTTGQFELTARKYKAGNLRAFYVGNVNFDLKVSGNLYLNEVRMRNFRTFVANELKGEFYKNIYGRYKRFLIIAFTRGSPLFN